MIIITPSVLLNLKSVHISRVHVITPKIVIGIIIALVTIIAPEEIARGWIIAAIPTESKGSVIFYPIKAPIATPWDFLTHNKATVNSGSEVPTAETEVPMIAPIFPWSKFSEPPNLRTESIKLFDA